MEQLRYQDIEGVFLVVFAVLFALLERFYPYRSDVDRTRAFKLDIWSFFILVIGVNISRFVVEKIYHAIHLEDFVSPLDMPFIFKLLLSHIISDFCLYWVHRSMHAWKPLWRAHMWHHSSPGLYWLAGFRTSLMHIFIYAFPQIFVGFYLFHFTPMELGIGFGLGVISQIWTHSNLRTPSWLPLHYFLVTPEWHHPHHSQLGTMNKNFGTVFTIWDWVFRTAVHPERIRRDYIYGIKEERSLWKMLIGI